jgi:2-methylcitrate dehydratase PrpD
VRDVSGAEFLTSVVAAYEINNRLIRAMQPSYDRFCQVHGVCQHQSVGAAIAYGKLVGLSAEAFENVIGFAGTLASVPSLRKYNWQRRPLVSFKDFNAPAAEAGVRAVQLHECGLIGAKDVLDGETGLWRMLGSDRFDAAALVTGLGEDWMLDHNAVKIYPVCRWMQTGLEAFAAIIAENNFSAQDIEAVTVHTSAAMAKDFMQYMVEDMIDAQFSFPYAIAAVALGVPVGAEWYRPVTMQRSDLRGFERRVHACVDPEIDQLMAGPLRRPSGRVTVRVAGRDYSSELFAYPSGSAERPVGPERIVDKFMNNAASVIGMDRAARCAALCTAIEVQPNARTLMDLAALV